MGVREGEGIHHLPHRVITKLSIPVPGSHTLSGSWVDG